LLRATLASLLADCIDQIDFMEISMNELWTQHYLRNGKSPDDLKEEFGIRIKQHPKYPNLYQFHYDQIESSSWRTHNIVRECRGLILDADKNWGIVTYPFKRFFNYGEKGADNIDWYTAKVYEKLDGSLIILYYYDGKWQVATKGSPDAAGNVGTSGRVFSEYFWDTFYSSGHHVNDLYTWTNYFFEFCSPESRVVVDYKKPEIYLIGKRIIYSTGAPGDELDITFHDGFNKPKSFPLSNFDQCIHAANQLNPISSEGFIVVDGWFNRVKIKSPAYVAIHHMKDGFGDRRIIELIKQGEVSEVLSYFPEYQEKYEIISSRITLLGCSIDAEHEKLKGIESQKEFAQAALATKFSAALFSIRKGEVKNGYEFILSQSVKKIEETCNG
jgi:hypothetical protein